jgi:hypothetical protein
LEHGQSFFSVQLNRHSSVIVNRHSYWWNIANVMFNCSILCSGVFASCKRTSWPRNERSRHRLLLLVVSIAMDDEIVGVCKKVIVSIHFKYDGNLWEG